MSAGQAGAPAWVPKASAIAREAGARLRTFFVQGVETEYKGDVDLVTVADRTSEALIRERLAKAFPEHGIYGEEGTRDQMESEFRWYVDTLDGTTNFAHGFPAFCVVLGLERRAVCVARRILGAARGLLRRRKLRVRLHGYWLRGRRVARRRVLV